MQLFIKNMVCDRCKMVVNAELQGLGLHPVTIELGVVALTEADLSADQMEEIRQRFDQIGFELLEDDESRTVERIRTAVIELVHRDDDSSPVKHSEYISARVGRDYASLSKLFSEKRGITVERYIILQKVEKIKELLAYGTQTVSEIAWKMGYSSVAALSAQFKKVAGLTPTEYKKVQSMDRITLDKIGSA